jgi:hypothetical protein
MAREDLGMAEKEKQAQGGDTVGTPPPVELGNSLEETCRKWFGEATWAAMSEADKAKARKLVAGDDQ